MGSTKWYENQREEIQNNDHRKIQQMGRMGEKDKQVNTRI